MADYIERGDALKAATLAELDMDFVIEAIRNIPAADVREVVHAHWEYDRKEDCAICSNCNDEIYLGTYHQFSNNYCPNCGADMREVDDD